MQEFSKILKTLREEQGVSQYQLAKIFNTSQHTIWAYENNKAEPSLDMLILIADFFKVNISYLLGRETEDGRIITNESPQNLPQPNKEEKAMLDIFSSLSRDGQYQILGFAEAISANEQRLRQLKKGNN